MLVTVVYATDENFVKYTLKSIQSLIKYSNPMNEYEIIVLTSDIKDISAFNKMEKDNIFIHVIEPDISGLNTFSNNRVLEYLTIFSFCRLLIPYLIDREWCIYLDGDTLIKCDIADLYYFRDIDYIIAGVYDSGNSGNHKPDYVNSGVLLMNLKYMREIDVMRLFKEYYTPDMYGDQDLINIALEGKVKLMPLKYNLFVNYKQFIKELSPNYAHEINDTNGNYAIKHFVCPENKQIMMETEI